MISIVVTHMIIDEDTLHLSNECLYKLIDNTYNKYELINVDNGGKLGSISYLAGKSSIYIRNILNKGNAKVWDQGVLLSNNDIIVVMDNDVWVEKNWDKGMVEMLSDPKVGITFPYSILGTNDYRATEYRGRKDGFCFAFTKDTYIKAGPFLQDQPFHSYYEDDNFFMNVMKMGLNLVACENSKVFHKGQGTTKKILNQELNDGIEANKQWFDNKWKGEYPYLTK